MVKKKRERPKSKDSYSKKKEMREKLMMLRKRKFLGARQKNPTRKRTVPGEKILDG